MKTNALKTPVFAVSLLAGLTLLLASCGNSAPPAEKTYTLTVSNLCPISVNVFIDNSAKGIFAPAQARDYTLTQGAHSIKAVPSGGGTPFEQLWLSLERSRLNFARDRTDILP